MVKKQALILIIAAVMVQYAYSQDRDFEYRSSGYFLLDLGYLNQGIDETGTAFEAFTHGAIGGGMVISANPSDFLSLRINPEIKSYHPFPREEGGGATDQRARWDAYISEARADFRFGDEERPSFYAGIGQLVYGENPHTRIFGNYLFRSMIYPGILFNGFNNPKGQIMGLQLGNNLGEGFNHNLFLTTSFNYFPYYDFSLSYEASYSVGDVFSVGGGIGLRNVLPVRPSLTSPERWDEERANVVIEVTPNQRIVLPDNGLGQDTVVIGEPVTLGAGQYALDSGATPGMIVTPITTHYADGTPQKNDTTIGVGVVGTFAGPLSSSHLDQMFEKDPVTGEYKPVVQSLNYKAEALSFAGTVLTFRASLNLMSLFGESPLGKDAFTLYMEGAVLGLKDYIGVYTDIRERMPIMVGLRLPTFNWLDFFAIEVEHYPSPHYPGFLDRMDEKVPTHGSKHLPPDLWHKPTQIDGSKKADDWIGNKDNLKWGVAVAKSFNGFGIAAQTGVDHTKMLDKNYLDYHDILQSSSDWYFQVRFMGGI